MLSNCNRNFWGQPSGWISWLFHPCTLCTYLELIMRKLNKIVVLPYLLLCMTLFSWFYAFRFFKSITLFSNHDNDTVQHILRHLNGAYERYIDYYINHRHKMYCCISYELVFDSFFMILLILEAPLILSEFTKTKIFYDQSLESAINA